MNKKKLKIIFNSLTGIKFTIFMKLRFKRRISGQLNKAKANEIKL